MLVYHLDCPQILKFSGRIKIENQIEEVVAKLLVHVLQSDVAVLPKRSRYLVEKVIQWLWKAIWKNSFSVAVPQNHSTVSKV